MRLAILLTLTALAGCAPARVHISDDKCWDLSDGDYVQGTANLDAWLPEAGCIECGAMIFNAKCRQKTVGLVIPYAQLSRYYNEAIHRLPTSKFGSVTARIYVEGRIVGNDATGKFRIHAEKLSIPAR